MTEVVEKKSMDLESIDNLTNLPLHTLDDEKLKAIMLKMPECDRAMRSFGRENSQTTAKLLTLSMLESGPYRVMRQCLAQIENKRKAIKEALIQIQLKKSELSELTSHADIWAFKINNEIQDSYVYIEGAFKEIGIYQDAYEQVRKKHNIRENWDEVDFENHEVEHHIKQAFRLALRDMTSMKTVSVGTLEYFEQLGINPMTATACVKAFVNKSEEKIAKDGQLTSITPWYAFLDNMVMTFKNEHTKALERIGLTSLVNPDLAYTEKE
jgi:hypothetical protein